MRSKWIFFIIYIFFPTVLFSANGYAISYSDFFKMVKEKSLSIKTANYSLEAAKQREKAGVYYFMPTLTATPSYKYEVKNNTSTDTKEIRAQAVSRLYSSDVPDRIKERKNNLQDAKVLIEIEEEKLKVSILKNLVSIVYYDRLLKFAIDLKKSVNGIEKQVKIQYQSGTSSQNNLNRVDLLLNKIDAEVNGIDKQISLFKSNISAITNLDYPKDGVIFKNKELDQMVNFIFNEALITNNLEYKSLKLKYDISRHLALQQNPLFNIDLSIDNNWTYNEAIEDFSDEPKVQISGKINLFNYAQGKEKKALLEEANIAKNKMDLKYIEIQNNVKNYLLLQDFHLSEIKNLSSQTKQIRKLIKGYSAEYQAGKVSLYEMLNTRFDLFTTTKQKTDIEIEFLQNKIDLMKSVGSVI